MINVSQSYLEKSLAPGRDVKCRIFAGGEVYTDADILSFEFNDVVHPEDMNFGTTCANRFHFELWSRHNIPLSALIRPFIGFADLTGNNSGVAEECTLGEFYITRRYRRRERYSVTCYDRMYRLDSRYNPAITFPCTAGDVLADIAAHYDFKIGFEPEADKIEFVPRTATCREVIGYIAGINGGFAKFGRDGVLQLKKLVLCDFVLSRNQYTELSVKADINEVRQIDFFVEDEIFSEGNGTKVSTYRQYNPFGSRDAAERLFNHWNGFQYHGLTVKMRGLPFLESGDAILVQDDFENSHYLALISDYTLTYDGGLTGRLVSKTKNPLDDYDEPMTRQRMIEELSQNLRVTYINCENKEDILIGGVPAALASLNFNLETRTFAVFNSQFSVTANEDCIMELEYFINNVKVGQTPETTLKKSEIKSICLYNCFRVMRPGRNTLILTAKVSAGNALIFKGELIASLSGQYMLGDGGPQRPEINISQCIEKNELRLINITIPKLSGKLVEPELQIPMPKSLFHSIENIAIKPLSPTLLKFSARVLIDSIFESAKKISTHEILLVFTNAVTPDGDTIDFNAFIVSFGIIELSIQSIEIKGREIILTIKENLNQYNELVVKYDMVFGNLLSALTRNQLQSFNYILNLDTNT
jgi:hypothetical protein